MFTRSKRSKAALVICCLAILGLSGCAMNTPFSSAPEGDMGSLEMGTFSNKVMDFDDLEIPTDMEFVNDDSIAMRTNSFEGGVLAYSGRVELESLKHYLISALENKQWKLAGEAQTEKTLLAFVKPTKTCMVVLEEGFGGKYGFTTATFYVTVDVTATSKLNPFGEPIAN